MNELEIYFNKLKKKYNNNKYNFHIEYNKDNIIIKEFEKIPKAIYPFYKIISKAELPFGTIFSIEDAIKLSKEQPFNDEWFVFGKDNYFSFWLCSYNPDSENLSFTSWDHECGEIGEPVYEDIISLFQDIEEEFDEYEKDYAKYEEEFEEYEE